MGLYAVCSVVFGGAMGLCCLRCKGLRCFECVVRVSMAVCGV